MIYKNPNEIRCRLNEIRCRLNEIGRITNDARDYGRRHLPKKFADFQREWDELHAARADCSWYCKGKSIEIKEASL